MSTNKLAIALLSLGSVVFIELYLKDDSVSIVNDPIAEKPYMNDNSAVFMSGCKTFSKPVQPKVVYPTVRRNFVNRLCALEVFPSNEAIAVTRNMTYLKEK